MRASVGEETFYINGRFLEQPLSGVQRFAREMVVAIDHLLDGPQADDARWCLLTTGMEVDVPRLNNIEICPIPSRLRGHAWEQVALARAARGGTLLGFAGSGPLIIRRQLVVIHDASVFRNPDFFSARYGFWHRILGRALARRARIATVSRFSREELAEVLQLPAPTIPVIYNGSDHMRRTIVSTELLDRLGLDGTPYFVLLGNLTRNKNVKAAIEALKHVPDAKLVLVGSFASKVFGKIPAEVGDDRVIIMGHVDDGNLAGLLAGANALLFPSFYEGFGIPPLEAMVYGCPVIASNIPAVREVCGDAAFYFDPRSPLDLADKMRGIMADDAGRQERRSQGQAQAGRFSWDQSAVELLKLCRSGWIAGGAA